MNTEQTQAQVEAQKRLEEQQATAIQQSDELAEAIVNLHRAGDIFAKVDTAIRTLQSNIQAFIVNNGGEEVVNAGIERGEFSELVIAKMRLEKLGEGLEEGKEEKKKAEEAVAKYTAV